MPYEKDDVKNAKEQKIFENNVTDPKVLMMPEDEKQKLSEDFNRVSESMQQEMESQEKSIKRRKNKQNVPDVPLSFFESIVAMLLSILGVMTIGQYKVSKLMKSVDKEILKIKPPIFNTSNRKITKYFALKVHELYLKVIWMKKIFEKTLDNKNNWEVNGINKSIVERLFEMMANIDLLEMDKFFSYKSIEKTISEFNNPKKGMEIIDSNLNTYLNSIDKSTVEFVNKSFTNISYLKKLIEFDFVYFFKRFDNGYAPGKVPDFYDMNGEAIISYISELEEAVLHIENNFDLIKPLKILNAISQEFNTQSEENNVEIPDSYTTITNEELEKNTIALFDLLKEFSYRNYFTLLIREIKKSPTYQPSVFHQNYDLYKTYVECIEKRVKSTAKEVLRVKRKADLDQKLSTIFPNLRWGGVYTSALSDEVEQFGFPALSHAYQIALVNSFMQFAYKDHIKATINVILLNGIFSERNFYKLVSETFYAFDQYIEKFDAYMVEISANGTSGERLLGLLSKKDPLQKENKKNIEKYIAMLNGSCSDLYEEFIRLFTTTQTFINQIYDDIENKPPKNIKNLRSIGGFNNSKFIQSIQKSYQTMQTMNLAIQFMKE